MPYRTLNVVRTTKRAVPSSGTRVKEDLDGYKKTMCTVVLGENAWFTVMLASDCQSVCVDFSPREQ